MGEKLIINARIYTVEEAGWSEHPKDSMVISESGKILAVGDGKDLSAQWQEAEVLPFEGKTILPGFYRYPCSYARRFPYPSV